MIQKPTRDSHRRFLCDVALSVTLPVSAVIEASRPPQEAFVDGGG